MGVDDTDKYVALAYWSKFFNDDDWGAIAFHEKKLRDLLEDLNDLAEEAVNFYLSNDRVPDLDTREE